MLVGKMYAVAYLFWHKSHVSEAIVDSKIEKTVRGKEMDELKD